MRYQFNTPILQMGKLRPGGQLMEADLRSGKISGGFWSGTCTRTYAMLQKS